jgi:hypothetical protein
VVIKPRPSPLTKPYVRARYYTSLSGHWLTAPYLYMQNAPGPNPQPNDIYLEAVEKQIKHTPGLCGDFVYAFSWKVNNLPPGASGSIIQVVQVCERVTDCGTEIIGDDGRRRIVKQVVPGIIEAVLKDGNCPTSQSIRGGRTFKCVEYIEAWSVDANGIIQPQFAGFNDAWRIHNKLKKGVHPFCQTEGERIFRGAARFFDSPIPANFRSPHECTFGGLVPSTIEHPTTWPHLPTPLGNAVVTQVDMRWDCCKDDGCCDQKNGTGSHLVSYYAAEVADLLPLPIGKKK